MINCYCQSNKCNVVDNDGYIKTLYDQLDIKRIESKVPNTIHLAIINQ